jgi:uncharacterized protein (TIGR03067 family)
MKVLLSVCGVLAVLTIVCMAAGQDTSPENTAQQDMEGLQGTWRGVKGPGSPGSDERAKNITFVVKFDKMTMTDANPDQKSTKEGTLKLDPKTKAFDWTDEKNGWIGIYELKGDDFKFYAVPMAAGEDKRPKSFDDKGGQLFVLKRSAAEPKENIAQTKKDMEGLQGTWRESKTNTVVVKGDRLSIIDSRPGQDTILGIITINPKTKAIDWAMRTGLGAGVTMFGNYELKGDNLRIIFGERKDGRPKTFDEKDGWLLVLKREP